MRKISLLFVLSTIILSPVLGGVTNYLAKDELIKKMQSGGLVLYFRHASTEKDYADQVTADVNDGSTQRVLSEKGLKEAVHIGRAIKYHNIPVSQVL